MHQIIIEEIKIPYLNQNRTIRIYLPPNYLTTDQFPVIYMHDAQNLFDVDTSSFGAIWNIHTHLNKYHKKTGKGIIVVGIDNYEGKFNRLNEYSPWVNTELKKANLLKDINEDVGGLGEDYINFIVNDLKPYIDDKYKTFTDRDNTAMIGSSMGGLISLYAATTYPDVFSKIGAFSTAVWFAEKELFESIKNLETHNKISWYVDIGTHETSNEKNKHFSQIYLKGSKNLSQHLKSTHPNDDVKLIVDRGGMHNEKDWSRRFYNALLFLFK